MSFQQFFFILRARYRLLLLVLLGTIGFAVAVSLLLPALLCLRPERRSLSAAAASPPPTTPTPTPDPEPEIHRMPAPHIAQPGIRRRAARQ